MAEHMCVIVCVCIIGKEAYVSVNKYYMGSYVSEGKFI